MQNKITKEETNNELFVCEWEQYGFDYDEDGESFNTSTLVGFTIHKTLGEAQSAKLIGNIGVFDLINFNSNKEFDGTEHIGCTSILIYDNNVLSGKYTFMDRDFWRYYEFKNHWLKAYENLMTYPPKLTDESAID